VIASGLRFMGAKGTSPASVQAAATEPEAATEPATQSWKL